MLLNSNQVQRVQEVIEKHLAKSNYFHWTVQFDGADWLVKDGQGGSVCKFPEVPQRPDLEAMISWGTATAPENMGTLWRSQLEYLANVVIPEALDEVRGQDHTRRAQVQQAQQ